MMARALAKWTNRLLALAWQGWRHYQLWRSNMRSAAGVIITKMARRTVLVSTRAPSPLGC